MNLTPQNLLNLDTILTMNEDNALALLPAVFPKIKQIEFKNYDGSLFIGNSIKDYMNMPASTFSSVKCPIMPVGNETSSLYRARVLLLIGNEALETKYPHLNTTESYNKNESFLILSSTLFSFNSIGIILSTKKSYTGLTKISIVIVFISFIHMIISIVYKYQIQDEINKYNQFSLVAKMSYADCYMDMAINSQYDAIIGVGVTFTLFYIFIFLFQIIYLSVH